MIITTMSTALVASTAAAVPLAGATSAHRAKHGVASDFDGDGRADLVMGGLSDDLRIRYSSTSKHGARVQTLTAADAGPQARGLGSVVAVGDFDGDGYSDLAVNATVHISAYKYPNRQAVVVFAGGPHGLRTGTPRIVAVRAPADTAVSYADDMDATDINGDGYADLRVNSEYYYDDDEDPVLHLHAHLPRVAARSRCRPSTPGS